MTVKRSIANAQPDFGAHFFTESDSPIYYEMRRYCGNGRHDVVYLSSYIHDAEFKLDEVRERSGTVTIPLRRARWEHYYLRDESDYIRSELQITCVKTTRLVLHESFEPAHVPLESLTRYIAKLQCIENNFRSEQTRSDNAASDVEVIIDCGVDERLSFRVSEDFTLILTDKKPCLRGKKTKKGRAAVE